jgi:hypothetical protein
VAAGAVVRLVVLWFKRGQDLLFNDSLYYAIQATNNGEGRWFGEASGPVEAWGVGPGADHPPLTSIVLALPSQLPHQLMAMRATTTVVGVVSMLAAVMLATTAAVVTPWVAYNTARFDRLVTMSTNDGNTLLGANCPLTYWGFELGG